MGDGGAVLIGVVGRTVISLAAESDRRGEGGGGREEGGGDILEYCYISSLKDKEVVMITPGAHEVVEGGKV